jgi:hypothetical protein
VPGSGHTVTVRCGPELHFTDLITAHEQRHGKLRPAGAPVTATSETISSSETAGAVPAAGASSKLISSSNSSGSSSNSSGSSSNSSSSDSCGLQCDLAQQSTVDERRLYSAIARRLEVSAVS